MSRSSPVNDGRVKFAFAEIEKELASLQKLIDGEFIDDAGPLIQLRNSLRSIANSPADQRARWEMRESYPLRTRSSTEYAGEVGGGRPIYALMSSIWEVTPLNQPGRPARTFEVAGEATTRVQLFEEHAEGDRFLGLWRMELGGPNNPPGTYFHAQILGQKVAGHQDDPDAPPFPAWMKIPRLPFPVATPASAIEFVIGELFQASWPARVAPSGAISGELGIWKGLQRERLERLFNWQIKVVRQGAGPTPLSSLKKARPENDIFLR